MILMLYGRKSIPELADALTGDVPGTPLAEQTVVATGGDWQPGDWQKDLADAAATAHPLTALAARTAPGERVLTSLEWANIARLLVRHSQWQDESWVAVRTGAQSMKLIAASQRRPSPATLHTAADMIRYKHRLAGPGAAEARHQAAPAAAKSTPDPAPPMRILDARHDRWDRLAVLVDRVPDLSELRFTPYPVPATDDAARSRHPGPYTLYVAVHPGGYVAFLLDTGDGQGCYGDPFDLHLTDGTSRVVVGPWSSRAEVVAEHAPAADIYPGQVTFHDRADDFHTNVSSGRVGHLSRAAAQRAVHLAAAHQPAPTHPAALAKAFDPPTAGSTSPAAGTPARPHPAHRPASGRRGPRR